MFWLEVITFLSSWLQVAFAHMLLLPHWNNFSLQHWDIAKMINLSTSPESQFSSLFSSWILCTVGRQNKGCTVEGFWIVKAQHSESGYGGHFLWFTTNTLCSHQLLGRRCTPRKKTRREFFKRNSCLLMRSSEKKICPWKLHSML